MLATSPKASLTRKRDGFTIVRVVLGVLLLVASGLKFADGDFGATDVVGPFASPFWHLASTEAEALLGGWLLLGAAQHILWLFALLFFLGLASVSLYLGIEGQPSCGCLGAKLPISPWYMLGLDSMAAASLGWWHPSQWHRMVLPFSATLRRVLVVAISSGVILATSFGGLTWMYGSPYEALLYVRGDSITIEPSVSQIGEAIAGEERIFTIRLTNHRDRPITITGGTATCSCITTSDLPIILPPKQSRSLTVQMRFRERPGRFQHSFVLYTYEENQQTVTARFAGRVIESPSQ